MRTVHSLIFAVVVDEREALETAHIVDVLACTRDDFFRAVFEQIHE